MTTYINSPSKKTGSSVLRISVLAASTFTMSACSGGPPDCTTDMGSKVYTTNHTADCKAISEMQTRIVDKFQVLGWSEASMTKAYSKLHIEIQPTPTWKNSNGIIVKGETVTGGDEIRIGTDSPLKKTSLAHESAHFFDSEISHRTGLEWGCSEADIKSYDADHCSWKRRGVWNAINDVNEEKMK